jgi:DNA-directed RNA polymerase specialized sigma24 family protein
VLAVERKVIQLEDADSARSLFHAFLSHALKHVVDRELARKRAARRHQPVDVDLIPTRSCNTESLASSLDIVARLARTRGTECATVAALRVQRFSEREIARRLGIPRGRVTFWLAAIRKACDPIAWQ